MQARPSMNLPKTTKIRLTEPRSVSGAMVKANGAKAGKMPVETSAAAGEAGTFLVVGARRTMVVRKRRMAIVRVRPKADLRADSPARRKTATAVRPSMDLQVVPHTVHLREDRRGRLRVDRTVDLRVRADLRGDLHTVRPRMDLTAVRTDRHRGRVGLLRADIPVTRTTDTVVRHRVDRTVRHRADIVVLPKVEIKVFSTPVDKVLATMDLNSVRTAVSPSTAPVQGIRGTLAENHAILRSILAADTTCTMRTKRFIMWAMGGITITITFASNAAMTIMVTSIKVTHIMVTRTGVTAIIRMDIQLDEGGRTIPARRTVAP